MTTNYINHWIHGDETMKTTTQISARIKHETGDKLETLMDMFNISRTEAIQGALDVGLDYLIHEGERALSKSSPVAKGKGGKKDA